MKRKNPYQMLKDEFRDFCNKVDYPRILPMGWFYPLEWLRHTRWDLTDLYYHVQKREKLGYDAVLKAEADGLHIQYIQKRPPRPLAVY